MYHFRSTRQRYKKLNNQDKKANICSFPSCEGDSEPITEENDTMYIIKNRVTYDIFEGRRVLDHLMVVPRRHIETLADFTQQEQLDHMEMLSRYEKAGYNVYARGVGSVTRSVKHQHTHLIKTSNELPKGIFYIRKPYFLLRK